MDLKKVHFYLYTFCRYFLATMILAYAFAKILGTQFVTQPATYDKPVGLLNGFELTWYYYGYSIWYGAFIAAAQIVSSLLLFFRKTTRVGIVLFLSFMVNILLVDFAYNIEGAKGLATTLTMMALFVFFSEFPLFFKYFLKEPPLFEDKARPDWVNKFSKIKWVYIPLVFVGLFILLSILKNKYMGINQFYGTWQNMDSSAPLSRLNFEAAHTFKVNGQFNHTKIAAGKYTFTKDSIILKAFTKEEQARLNSDKTNVLNPDTTKMTILLKGKYQVNKNTLTIQTASHQIRYKRIR